MPNAREILELVITGDGRGAIVEVERVGSAAKRELAETDRNLEQLGRRATSFGVGALTAGAAATAMLFGTAKAAGQTETDIGRVEGAFGSASAAAIAFIKDSNDIGLSDQVAASYVAQIGDLAVGMKLARDEAAGLTVQSVDLITQLSLIKGVDPGEGLDALASGLIGEYDALQRLVPTISAAAIENRALAESGKSSADELTGAEKAAATFGIVIDSATDSIERAGGVQETLAVRNARVAATWGDIKTRVGEGALPVMEQAAGVAEWVADAMTAADEATGGWTTRLVTVAAVGTAAAGGVSLIVGQGISAYQAIGDMNISLRDAEGNLTKTGRAARVTAAGLGVLAAIGVIQIGLEFVNESAGFDQDIEDDINRIISSVGDADAQLEAFANGALTRAKELSLGDGPKLLASQLNIFGQSMLALPGAENLQPLADVQAFFDDLASKSPEQAAAVLASYEVFTAGLDKNSREYKANTEFIDRNRESLRLSASAQRAAGDAASDSADDQADLTGEFTKQATAASEALAPIMKIADAQDRLTEAERELAEVADTNSREVRDAQRSVQDSYRGVEDAVRGVADAERGVVDARRRVGDATRNLADAQRELNELLADDPMFGLKSVSPEEQIADAQRRLDEANARLLANPQDAIALGQRDNALDDLERAKARRQEIAREGDQRARDIENAQRRVEDAQRNLEDANRGVGDSERALADARRAVGDAQMAVADAQAVLAEVQSQHGVNSEAYADAARAVVDAALEMQTADAELADSMREKGGAAVREMIEALDVMISRGGPVGEAAAAMKGELESLVAGAEAYADSLNIDEPVAGMRTVMEQWFGWTTGHPPAVAHVDADTTAANDTTNWFRWTQAAEPVTLTVESRLGASWDSTFSKISDRYRASQGIPDAPLLNPQMGLPGGRDGDPTTPYHTGGPIRGAARGQEIPILALGGEGVTSLPGMDFLGPGGQDDINAGRLPRKLRAEMRRVADLQLAVGGGRGAVGAAAPGGTAEQAAAGLGDIRATIQMVTPDPRTSGVEVIEELRRIGHRSGRGMAVDTALGIG